jgi:hypothetical protein
VPVDVRTEIEIARPREEVAAYAVDPDKATAWYRNIKQVDWQTPPLAVGSRLSFVAQFLGLALRPGVGHRSWPSGPGHSYVPSPGHNCAGFGRSRNREQLWPSGQGCKGRANLLDRAAPPA